MTYANVTSRSSSNSMVALEGGSTLVGSLDFYPEERPVRNVAIDPFRIDRYAVTNTRFAAFVGQTGYVTMAERGLNPADYPGVPVDSLAPGSLVFTSTTGPVNLSDWRQWWSWVPGANWRQPKGPRSDLDDLMDHPVVQVSYEDAEAFARWDGKRLPTEVEWEFAARGGLVSTTYAWGNEPATPDDLRANTWQGNFPYRNTGARGWVGTSPVGSFAPNGFGLYDMTGNTWEWTTDYWATAVGRGGGGAASPPPTPDSASVFAPDSAGNSSCGCGGGEGEARRALKSAEPGSAIPRRVLKGGSHLCAPEYCLRYRPAARSAQAEDSAATHIGFRCVL